MLAVTLSDAGLDDLGRTTAQLVVIDPPTRRSL